MHGNAGAFSKEIYYFFAQNQITSFSSKHLNSEKWMNHVQITNKMAFDMWW